MKTFFPRGRDVVDTGSLEEISLLIVVAAGVVVVVGLVVVVSRSTVLFFAYGRRFNVQPDGERAEGAELGIGEGVLVVAGLGVDVTNFLPRKPRPRLK